MGHSVTERVESMLTTRVVRDLAADCGFDAAGIAAPFPKPEFARFQSWTERGLAGEMGYLTDQRRFLRNEPEKLLSGLKSIICVGIVYNAPEPYSTAFPDAERAWISRYAWGTDYHSLLRHKLEDFALKLLQIQDFSYGICVDTAPLLERSFARQAGLGWIGRNTCLINQNLGSWLFLGELLTTLELAPDAPPPDRCGTCTQCIDACPTAAIVPSPDGQFELDSRLCISYFTIELRASIPEAQRPLLGHHVFGCDICQDVCPWNRRAATTGESAFLPREVAPPLERMASLTEPEFRALFRDTPVSRAKYSGFLRNVAIAMGNARLEKFRAPLEKLAASPDPLVSEHAAWALGMLPEAHHNR
jgi:epoxyqueuosine reductase